MKVIFTDQAYDNLVDLSHFLLEKQGCTLEKSLDISDCC